MTKKESKLPLLELFFILFYIYICLNPQMNALISMLQFLIMHMLYTFYAILKDRSLCKTSINLLFASFIIALMYVATTSMVYVDDNVSNRYVKGFLTIFNSYYGLVFPILLFCRVNLYASKTQKLLLLIFAIIILIFVIKMSIVELQINERILKSRMGASLDDEKSFIGGYTFVCAAPILATGCFYSFVMSKDIIIRSLMLFSTLFLLYFLVESMYSIALLAAVLGIIFCLYVKTSRRIKKIYIIFLLLGWFLAPTILNYFITILDDGDTKLRMIELRNFFLTGDFGDEDLGVRMEYYGRGIVAFFRSPIWGQYHLGFNTHSTIIEVFASTGIIGGYSLFILLSKSFSVLNNANKNYSILPVCYSFLFMAFTNPVHASPTLNISLWLIVPLLFNLIPQKS